MLEKDLLFLPIMLVPAPLDTDSQNTLFTIMEFFMALSLVKEVISQQRECNNGLIPIELTGLTRCLITWKQLAQLKGRIAEERGKTVD